jgi:hypothetical protein
MDPEFEVGEEVLIKYSIIKDDRIGVVTNITKTGMIDVTDINGFPRRFNSNGYARGSKRTRIAKATTEQLREVKKNDAFALIRRKFGIELSPERIPVRELPTLNTILELIKQLEEN